MTSVPFLERVEHDTNLRADNADERFGSRVRIYSGGELERGTIAMLGVPQDQGVARNGGRLGAALGPAAVREQFFKLSTSVINRSVSMESPIVDLGNVRCEGLSLEEIHARVESVVSHVLDAGAFCIVLGGGHDIAWPNAKAVLDCSPTMAFINVDAHPDLRPLVELNATLVAHSGSPFRQILEYGAQKIPAGTCSVIGIQPFTASYKHLEFLRERGHHVVSLRASREAGIEARYRSALLAARAAEALYCSFDIDAVSGAWAPGVSAVAVDGYTPSDMISMVRSAAADPRTKLMDFVELNPLHDVDSRSARLVAHLLAHAIDARTCSQDVEL